MEWKCLVVSLSIAALTIADPSYSTQFKPSAIQVHDQGRFTEAIWNTYKITWQHILDDIVSTQSCIKRNEIQIASDSTKWPILHVQPEITYTCEQFNQFSQQSTSVMSQYVTRSTDSTLLVPALHRYLHIFFIQIRIHFIQWWQTIGLVPLSSFSNYSLRSTSMDRFTSWPPKSREVSWHFEC